MSAKQMSKRTSSLLVKTFAPSCGDLDEQLYDTIKVSSPTVDPQSVRPLEDFGWVYLVGGGGYYKIGRTANLHPRTKWFELKLPFPVVVVDAFWGPYQRDNEVLMHRSFASKRTNGEWFALEHSDVEWFGHIARRFRAWMHAEGLEPLR